MDTSDELAALEFDFRRALIAELERVSRTGDERFFELDQRQVSGQSTLQQLADEIIELRLKMKPPVTRCVAADFLGCCVRWGMSTVREKPASAGLASELLERVRSENDG